VLCSLIAAVAHAQPETSDAELAWVRLDGAEACPDARAMRRAIARRLGRDPFGREPGPLIEALASRQDATWTARINARSASGELVGSRELGSRATSCDSLADAAALAIALVIDPEAVERIEAQRSAPEPAPAPTVPAPRAEPASRPAPGPLAWVDLRAIASGGLLPGFAPGLSLAVELELARWLALSAGLAYWPEQKADGRPNGAVGVGLSAGSIAACAEPVALPPLGTALCAGALLGSIHTVVYELIPTAPGDRLWTALSAGVRVYAPRAAPLRVSMALDALAPLTRHRFTVGGQTGTVFRQRALALSAQLGLGLHF
jgi:hypothetical protein